MSLLLDGASHPLVPPSLLADVEEINPRLGLVYHPALRAFMVTLRWLEDDPRRAYIRAGQIAPDSDYEILFPVPTDIKTDDMRGWIAGCLRRAATSRDDIRRMVEEEEARLAKHNEAVVETKLAEAKEALAASAGTKTIDVGKRRTRVK